MTTVLSNKGQIVLPVAIRDQLGLKPGDDFEIVVAEEDSIVLRKISMPPNRGLVEHLLACPYSFDIPDRSKEAAREVEIF